MFFHQNPFFSHLFTLRRQRLCATETVLQLGQHTGMLHSASVTFRLGNSARISFD